MTMAMAWQVLAMWLIVATTLVWFVRDERRVRAEALNMQALRFAYAPAYPRAVVERPVMPRPAPRGMSGADRAYLMKYLKAGAEE